MKDTVVKLYGEEAIGAFPTMMGSEDFPWYAEDGKRPYYFSIIGGREPGSESTISNHHEKFLPEESALKRGSAVMAQFAFDYLKQNAK